MLEQIRLSNICYMSLQELNVYKQFIDFNKKIGQF